MFINIYDEETRGLRKKTNGTETLYFFVLNCLRNQPDLSFSEQQLLGVRSATGRRPNRCEDVCRDERKAKNRIDRVNKKRK